MLSRALRLVSGAPVPKSCRPSVRAFSLTATRLAEGAGERPPPGELNRHSRLITVPKDQGASQAMLYATQGIDTDEDLKRAMVGVASVW